ncbi:MAG: VWA domain-containing protein [Gallionellaceae bacterium]|nr:VWA domain-containing protein [Gallionellaceae bacterium]
MFELAQPLWLLPLPVIVWLVWRWVDAGPAAGMVLNHPGLGLDAATGETAPSRWPRLLEALALALLLLALAQPREVGEWIAPPPEGRDIVLVVDTSQTMSIDDFRLSGKKAERLAVLKAVLGRFVRGRVGDRFGVLAFGSTAATLTPPTFDHTHVIAQIERLQIGMAGDNTALGDALGLAVKQVRQTGLRPAVILVSDGAESNSGDLTPGEAVAVARQLGVAVHTLQIGGDLFAAGRPANAAEADPQPGLADIARLSGGRHWIVKSTDDAEQVINAIGQLEPTLARPARQRQTHEWYWLPLALSAALLSLAQFTRLRTA